MEREFTSPDSVNPAQITGCGVEAPLDLWFLLMNHTIWALPLALSFCEPGKAGEGYKKEIVHPAKSSCIIPTAYIYTPCSRKRKVVRVTKSYAAARSSWNPELTIS